MAKFKIRVFSHNFSVKVVGDSGAMRDVVRRFASWFDKYDWQEQGGQWQKVWSNRFAYPQPDPEGDSVDLLDHDLEQRFHINALQHFKNLLAKEHFSEEEIEIQNEPIYEAIQVAFNLKPHFQPLDHQVPIIPQLKVPTPISKLLPLYTGGGKSYLSLLAAAHWGYRTAYLMKPGYIGKWMDDIDKTLLIDISKVETVMGSEALIELMRGIDYGYKDPQIILISNATFRNWIAEQEKMPPGELVPGFPCYPWEFFQYCGIGFRAIDEVHQDYHANFRFDLVTHVEQSLSMSATMDTKDEYLKKMYKLAYPDNAWIDVPPQPKYIRTISWHFDFLDPQRIKTTSRGRTTYSHVEFEKSIMRSTKIKKQYMLMVYEAMRKTYMFERKEGERCLVFFATRQMCEDAVFFFRQLLPHLKIAKYNQGDPDKNIKESDLCFATLGKAGTAIDIANLTTVILTVGIESVQSNKQSSGRLRDLKLYGNPRMPTFVYFVCDNFEKHKRYHQVKMQDLKEKTAVYTKMVHHHSLGA